MHPENSKSWYMCVSKIQMLTTIFTSSNKIKHSFEIIIKIKGERIIDPTAKYAMDTSFHLI